MHDINEHVDRKGYMHVTAVVKMLLCIPKHSEKAALISVSEIK